MIIKKDRVPLKFLIFAQHNKSKINKFSTADILKFFRDNPMYIETMVGIGRTKRENKIRSFLRGLPGNISMVLNAIGVVNGSDNYYYKLPDVLFKAIKSGMLRFNSMADGNFEVKFTNIEKTSEKKFQSFKDKIENAIQIFLDRKTREVKLRDYHKTWKERRIIKEIIASGRKVEQYCFEQRKVCFKTDKYEHFYIPYSTVPYEEMLKKNPTIYYSISKSLMFHSNCPNFVFRVLDEELELVDFYSVPFSVFDELVFKKIKPDHADIFYFFIKKIGGKNWLFHKNNKPLLLLDDYNKLNKVEDIRKAPYTSPYQSARLEEYRKQLHAQLTSSYDDKIELIKKYKEANEEVNAVSYIESLSLAKALKIKQKEVEKTILVVRVDTAYPDLLCIYLDDLTIEEKFNKTIDKLDLLDLFLIRHNIIQDVDKYKERLFEIEAEYDAHGFKSHESPRDDIMRSRFVAAWTSNYKDDIYKTEKKLEIPIIKIKELWGNLIKDIQAQKKYAS